MKTVIVLFLMAQNAGLRVGIAPVATGFPATQAPAVVTDRPFVAIPRVVFPVVPPPPRTVIVPNHILLPGQTVFPDPMAPPPVFFAPAALPAQHQVQPQPQFPHPGRPAPGTPRSEVIRQYGAPSVTVMTSSGETLYFTGGVTVIIQNGQVTGPR